MNLYYDRSGRPMTFASWAKAFNGPRHVGLDTVGDAEVSTVWLGTTQSLGGLRPIGIFETMIFGGKHDQYQERHDTEEEAKAEHERVVKALRDGVDP